MSSFDIISLERRQDWEATVAAFDHDVYHRWDFHQLAFDNGEGDPVLITWGDGSNAAALPLVVRAIPSTDRVDATSVYGYPGPLFNGPPRGADPVALAEALGELGLVSVFSRLNPLMNTDHVLADLGTTIPLGPTVSLDLSIDTEQRLLSYSRSTRRRIRRLEQMGAEALVDEEFEHLDDFLSMYQSAMRRIGADESYSFGPQWQNRARALLGESVSLIVCRLDDEVLVAGLYLSDGETVSAYLAADNPDARQLAPQRLEIHAAAGIFAERGFRRLQLGGGVGSQDDSLLEFKRGFGGDESRFSVWSHIVDTDAYNRLSSKQATPSAEGANFPAYRDVNNRATPLPAPNEVDDADA
jgi:hypothetical protein